MRPRRSWDARAADGKLRTIYPDRTVPNAPFLFDSPDSHTGNAVSNDAQEAYKWIYPLSIIICILTD